MNDKVTVTLTEYGAAVINTHRMDWFKQFPIHPPTLVRPGERYTEQLWVILRELQLGGMEWKNGMKNPFEFNRIEIAAALIADAPELLRQRDALLAALKEIAGYASLSNYSQYIAEMKNIARDAIAATKGGA